MMCHRIRGLIVQHNWHETSEGKEYIGAIVRRNKRRIFGLLESPIFTGCQVQPEIVTYKIFLHGKAGVGKTCTIAKLCGHEIPAIHCETPGIQVMTLYWPVKLLQENRVILCKIEFWDAGENAIKKFDHILPACKYRASAIMFLFSITDRSSFDDLVLQIDRVVESQDKVLKLAVATRFDKFLHSDVSEQDMEDFEGHWGIPILKTANVNGPLLPDGKTLDGRAGIADVAPFLNSLVEYLWYFDQGGTFIPQGKTNLQTTPSDVVKGASALVQRMSLLTEHKLPSSRQDMPSSPHSTPPRSLHVSPYSTPPQRSANTTPKMKYKNYNLNQPKPQKQTSGTATPSTTPHGSKRGTPHSTPAHSNSPHSTPPQTANVTPLGTPPRSRSGTPRSMHKDIGPREGGPTNFRNNVVQETGQPPLAVPTQNRVGSSSSSGGLKNLPPQTNKTDVAQQPKPNPQKPEQTHPLISGSCYPSTTWL